jgi:redox-sensing transcriptional repressor
VKKTSAKTIGRLSLYRLLLDNLRRDNGITVYSHELAAAANCSAAQVRRDLMSLDYAGSPVHGYRITDLIESIDNFLDHPQGQSVALVGVGNLGRAILSYFRGRRPKLSIVAAFDDDEHKINRVINGTWCYPMADLRKIVKEKNILVGVITVPPNAAQTVADQLIEAGVHGLLNFAPARLKAPPQVYLEDVDMTMSLEKVAYFSRLRAEE